MSTTAIVATPAHADSLKARIAAAHRQLSALDAKAEAATERYNAARIQLSADQQKAQSAQRRLTAAQAVLGRLQKSVTAFAVAAYQGQAIDMTMGVTADSPQQFLDKVATLQAVANSQSQTLARLDAAQRAEEQARSTADAALKEQAGATKQMQADRASVLAAAHQEQQILSQLQARE